MSNATATRRDARRREQRRRQLLLAGIAVGVVILAVLVAVLSTGEQDRAVSVEDIAGDHQRRSATHASRVRTR